MKSNVIPFKDYATSRIACTLIQACVQLLKRLSELEKRSLCYEASKSQSMARVYLSACIMELEKMSFAQEKHLRSAHELPTSNFLN